MEGDVLFRKADAECLVVQAGWAFPAGVVRFFRCPKGSRLVGARLGRCGSLAFLGRVWDGTVSEFPFHGRCRIVSKSGCGRFVVQAGWAFPAGRCGSFVARKVCGRGARLGRCGSRAFLGCVGAELFRSFCLDVKRLRPEEPSYRLGVGMREEYGGECRFRSDRASPVPNGAGPSGSGAATGESE